VAPVRLSDITARLGGELHGDPALAIDRIGPLEGASAGTLSFLSNPRYRAALQSTGAGCVIVAPDMLDAALARAEGAAAIVADDPYLYFARVTQWWAERTRAPRPSGVHPSAVVEAGATVHTSASIGPFVQVCAGAEVGADVQIGSGCHIGRDAKVGAGSRLAPQVTLGDDCHLGANCIVHSGVVIGADGFGFAPNQGRWEKIEQLGGVRIGSEVEIGANTCIDRGALEHTVIEDGVKLDNLIQIGHNVHIGAHTAIAGCTAVAGSARIGAHCTIAGSVNIVGHIHIAEGTHVAAATLVSRTITTPGRYAGAFPFDDNATWEKNAATLRQLYRLRERLRALEKKTPP
jgi:UDP-3-O-[3-hydroxymyristoyl] glucosamine N-acyltransferase